MGVGGGIAIFIGLAFVFLLILYYKKKRRKVEHNVEKGSTVSGTLMDSSVGLYCLVYDVESLLYRNSLQDVECVNS